MYAFGLLLYEILAGKRARIGLKTDEVMRQAIEGTIDYGALEGVPEELVTIVRQATIARAAERPPIGVAVTELDGWLSHQETVALAVEKKVVEEKVAEVVDPRPVKVPPMVPPPRVRVSFVRLVVVGMIVCMIGGLMVGMLGVKVANAYFTQPPLRVIP